MNGTLANQSVRGARDMWLWLRVPWFSTWGRHHVPGKLASLRSRIRGGSDNLVVSAGYRRSVLDAPLNPNWFHSCGLR